MKSKTLKCLCLGTFLFLCFTVSKAQNVKIEENGDRNIVVVGAKKTLAVGGKITYIVAKESAKVGWETTKFVTKEIAAPIAKTLIVKAAPKFSKFVIKRAAPIVFKAAITYLKL